MWQERHKYAIATQFGRVVAFTKAHKSKTDSAIQSAAIPSGEQQCINVAVDALSGQ